MNSCDIVECPFSGGGACREGLGELCPHIVVVDPAAVETLPDAGGDLESLPLDLNSGSPLEIPEARLIARRGRARVISLVGLIECGKTSLIARIYQQFMAGPVEGYKFHGSRTLPRFEELTWLSTIESGVTKPLMDRTSRFLDKTFLHLAVRPDRDSPITDLLLNDISGETVTDGVSAQNICDGLVTLARADHVVVVVDGGALADSDDCHDHVAKLRDFFQRLLQGGQVGTNTIVHLVFSKIDKIVGGEAIAASLETHFREVVADRIGELHVWRTAARPMDGSDPTESEIGKLLATWVERSLRYPLPKPPSASISWERDYCRFGMWARAKGAE